MSAAGHDAGKQSKKARLQGRVAGDLVSLTLPARVEERDETLFKAISPVVGVKRRHSCRKPPDPGKQKAGYGRLNGEIQKSCDDLRDSKPSVRALANTLYIPATIGPNAGSCPSLFMRESNPSS